METDDTDLMIARGVYSTLNYQRKETVESIQQIANAIMTAASKCLSTCNLDEPDYAGALKFTDGVTKNLPRLASMIEDLQKINSDRAEWKPKAWPK